MSTNLAIEHAPAAQMLSDAVADLMDLRHAVTIADRYQDFESRFRVLLESIAHCESQEVDRSVIRALVGPVRTFVGESQLARRLQTWPRGYQGDFETIELICSGVNQSMPGTMAYLVESWALSCPPVQQHRNKVARQAALIRHCISTKFGRTPASILSIACGPSRDLRQAASEIDIPRDCRVVLNDIDDAALRFSRARLGRLSDQCSFVTANALMQARTAAHAGAFDLILVGGLCDYLTDRQCHLLIRALFRALRHEGTLFFTNIAHRNPYRGCMEYVIDWQLLERSADDILDICRRAGIADGQVNIARDATGLSLLAEVRR